MKTVKWSAMTAERPLDLSGWLARIEACHPAEIELGLNRLQQVAQRLPIDLESVCKIVIAGTNGKGSTLAMLDAILSRAGYTTGSYTSPHFLRLQRACLCLGQSL